LHDGIKVALHHLGAAMRGAVIAAIDLGPSSARVLQHAAGFARLLSAPLTVLHVCADRSTEERERVIDFCKRVGPYEIDIDETNVVVRVGHVSEAIRREAVKDAARLVVIGSRGHGGLAKLLLGSSSEAVLRNTVAPVLLVPPVELEIVSIADRAQLNSGPILAAVDLAEACDHQLSIASRMADLAKQPLLLMTVAPVRLSDHQAARMLRERGHHLSPVRPRATIVRRGKVAEEISRCASAEGAGLVVMGLRTRPRGQPGTIASAVLKTNRAFVLAVPGC
jgi:nucleotide-binding universal stress UspA family protein